MQIDNGTPFVCGFTLAMDSEGREHAVVAVKGTLDFPLSQEGYCTLSAVQDDLVLADTFWGEPGVSAPRSEMDFAHIKTRCDVILEASAYAPGGRPAQSVAAGARVGAMSKIVNVIGDRHWLSSETNPGISAIRSFERMPITYDRAFGGVDTLDPSEDPPHAFLENPVGCGWHRARNRLRLDGAALPNIEHQSHPVRVPWGNYKAASFGPLARGWPQRVRFGGTYDQSWIDNVFPFLPKDFDPRYYQSAPEDQQIDFLTGGETITLLNLTPDGRTTFRLPGLDLPLVFVRRRREDVAVPARADTLVIRPDERRICVTWRASIPLERDIFEVSECIVGRRSAGFWRARRLGKTYYPSVGAMVAARRDPEWAE